MIKIAADAANVETTPDNAVKCALFPTHLHGVCSISAPFLFHPQPSPSRVYTMPAYRDDPAGSYYDTVPVSGVLYKYTHDVLI